MSIKLRRTDVPRVRDKLLDNQEGICSLCATEIQPGMAVLDHSHKHGHIRAVLCRNCNSMEGKVFNLARRAKRTGTELEWLRRLVAYLEFHEEPKTPYVHHTHKTEAEKKVAALKRKAKRKLSSAKGKAEVKKCLLKKN